MTTRTTTPKKTATAEAAALAASEAQQQGADDAGQDDTAAEEAAHLQRLQQGAAEADDASGPHLADVGEDPPAPAVNLEAEIAALAKVAVAMLGPMFPSLREVYTPETIEAAASVTAPLCRKHGWLPNGIGGKYAEEIAAAAVLAPLAYATYRGITHDLAEAQRKKAGQGEATPLPDLSAQAPEAPAAPKTVTFGAPIPEGAPA